MITWTANENIWYVSILTATNVISNTLEYALGIDRLTWKGVGRERGCYAMVFSYKTFWCWILKKKYFGKQNARKKYSDARFSPIKIVFFWLQGRNRSLPFKLKGRSLARFHYYIFLLGYGYNCIFCGHCQIAVGVHWMEFVSHK
jgi:hypothetical protein